MVASIRTKHTITPNSPPVGLQPGELAVELDTPTRLWVGVPGAMDPTQRKLLFDSSVVPPNPADFVEIAGDTMTGPLIGTTATYSGIVEALTLDVKVPAGIGDALLRLEGPAGYGQQVVGQKGGLRHWSIDLGNAAAASDFGVIRYDPPGTFASAPLSIVRATGRVGMLNGADIDAGASVQGGIAVAGGIAYTDRGVEAYAFAYNGASNRIFRDGVDQGNIVMSNGAALGAQLTDINNAFVEGGNTTFWIQWPGGGQGGITYLPVFRADTILASRAESDDALALIEQLPVKEITFRNPAPQEPDRIDHWTYALLPDDVRPLLPEAAAGDLIRTEPLIAALVKAVQQLSARVATLETAA